MNAAATTRTKRISVTQLRREGFTSRQVRQLQALRANYPVSEFVSSQDMRRLELLRWMRQNGRLAD